MRNKFILPLLFAVLSCVLLWHAERSAGQSGKDKKPALKIDPGAVFDLMMSKGRGYFLITEVPRDRVELEKFAAQEGIKNGKVTRNQFIKYWNLRSEQRKQEERQREELVRREAEAEEAAMRAFNNLDLNGDGFLNANEINQSREFKSEWRKWDTDGDDLISLAEWKVYWRQKHLNPGKLVKKDAEEQTEPLPIQSKTPGKLPVVKIDIKPQEAKPGKRIDRLPATLPAWFKQLDLDGDGQISLYEWKKAGKDIEEFIKLDLNDDGFLNVEEVLRSQGIFIMPKTGKEQKKDDSKKKFD
jgi:EF hand